MASYKYTECSSCHKTWRCLVNGGLYRPYLCESCCTWYDVDYETGNECRPGSYYSEPSDDDEDD